MADREKTDATPEDKKDTVDPDKMTDDELEQVSGGNRCSMGSAVPAKNT